MRHSIPTLALVVWLMMGVPNTSTATPAQSFSLHLECKGGVGLDIVVPTGASYAGLVDGSNAVGMLKGEDEDADETPEFLVPGFTMDELTQCDALSGSEDDPTFEFVAYVLFTPRGGDT